MFIRQKAIVLPGMNDTTDIGVYLPESHDDECSVGLSMGYKEYRLTLEAEYNNHKKSILVTFQRWFTTWTIYNIGKVRTIRQNKDKYSAKMLWTRYTCPSYTFNNRILIVWMYSNLFFPIGSIIWILSDSLKI